MVQFGKRDKQRFLIAGLVSQGNILGRMVTMGFLKKLFGKKTDAVVPPGKPAQAAAPSKASKASKSYTEQDNRGTRHDTMSLAQGYWFSRNFGGGKKEPFLLYAFDTREKARTALLELPCIHVASDSGNLISTEIILFGYYPRDNDGKYEAIVCGDRLSHDLWAQAKASFIKYGGQPVGQGELEPAKSAAPVVATAKVTSPGTVTFVREERKVIYGQTMTYRIHTGPNEASAMAFLEKTPVTRQFYYIVVETPVGNFCRDIQGIYKE
ncbi:MAG: hypothetical protein JXA10_07415 [Anaerolineae bacterium]|nr:hypothetical protein [Anaerolineae bacterium]